MLLFIYRILINSVLIISPFIIVFRLIKKKENFYRFKEKFTFFSKKKFKKKLVWFHGASVGELLSVIPLIEKLEKNKNIDQILVTTSTVSSSKVFGNFKFKKTVHQFFPIDTNFISKKFLHYWRPSVAIFIDSEIWPNMLINLKKNNVPTLLLNARITKKSFKRWKIFGNFSKSIFKCFDLTFPCNKETELYLKFFGVKNIKLITNLKFIQKNSIIKVPLHIENFFSDKLFWCAASTHNGEEETCFNLHKKLKNKNKKFVSIIIPRHIERKDELIELMNKYQLKFHCHSWKKRISNNIDIYLVDSYGETEIFYKLNKIVFMGGSIVKHGGQNPLEAVRNACKIINGPYVENFKDIYKLLEKFGISKKINSSSGLEKGIKQLLNKKKETVKINKKIKKIGTKLLKDITKELNKII